MKNKTTSKQFKSSCAAMLLIITAQTTLANPLGPSVVNGQASFATSGNTLTVTNTPGTIINWQDFSIGSKEFTHFAQQSASSSVLNRVISSNPSSILGTLQSNGRVFLVNPNGIVFGQGATVDVAGLVATSLNLGNADFLAGRYNFSQIAGAQSVSNAGSLSAQSGGQIYLIAPDVENTGIIAAPNGEILLAAGHSVDLLNSTEPNLRVSITAPAGDATNIGQLIAESGSLGLFGTVVRNSGTASADSATRQGGKIVFKAAQSTELSGVASATGTTGGTIQALGNQVALNGNAHLDASGTHGGGRVLVGGDAHGANPDIVNARNTFVGGNATIKADATQNGDGGKVVVWSDIQTVFEGLISTVGGALSGDGGWAEVSGKQNLSFLGAVDTTAANGNTGTLLLDPTDIAISSVTGSPTMASAGAATVTFTDVVASPSILNVTTLQNQLGSSNVIVDTASGQAGLGDINVETSFTWSSGNSLELRANNNINIAGGVSINGGSGDLYFSAGNSIFQGAGSVVTGNTLTLLNPSVGGINMSGANMVNTLAANMDNGGSLSFTNGQNLIIGAGTGVNGISAANNTSGIWVYATASSLTVDQPIVSDALGANSISISLDAGTLNINAPLTSTLNAAPTGIVILQAGTGGVTSNASGIITASGLVALSGSSVTLNAANAINSLAGLSAGNFQFTNSHGFNVDFVSDWSGLTASTGSINLKAAGNGQLGIVAAVAATTGDVVYVADSINLAANATTTAAGAVAVKPASAATNIDLGGTDINGTLGLTQAELSQVTASTLRIGDLAGTGNLNVSAAIAPANISTLSLEAGGDISQSAGGTIGATNLAIRTGGNVLLGTASNSVGVLAGSISNTAPGAEYFHFKTGGNLSIGSVDGITGINIANFPNYTAGSFSGAIKLEAGGNITQTATANLGGAAVWASSTGGLVDLTTATGGNATGIIAGNAYSNYSYRSSNPILLTDVAGHSGIASSMSGDIVVAGSGFTNGVATPFTTSVGRWFVYAPNPASVSKGGLTSDFRQYSTAYGGTINAQAGSGFIYASAPGVLNVDTTLSSGASSHTYGNVPTAVFGYSFGNPTIADNEDLALFTGTPAFTPALSSRTNVGGYSVSYASGLTSSAGYTFAPGNGLLYTVDPAPITLITITAGLTGSASKIYDGTDAATLTPANFLLSGFVSTDSAIVTKTSGTYASPSAGNGILVSTTLAPADFTPGVGTLLSNYILPTSASGNIGNIAQAPLIIAANNDSKAYDAVPYSGGNGVTYSGFVPNETSAMLGGVLTYSGASQGAINKGIYPITPGGYTSSNYAISYVDGTLTITPAALFITAALSGSANKTYDGTDAATLAPGNFLLSGFVSTDSAIVTKTSGTYATQNAGNGILVSTTLAPTDFTPGVGTLLSNYILPNSASGNIGNIAQAPLTVQANAQSKVYGSVDPALTYVTTGLLLTDSLVGGLTRTVGENAGTYAISQGTLDNPNYAISYIGNNLSITPAPLTVTANSATKVYDGQPFNGGNGVTYSGLTHGDTATALGGTLTYSGTSQGAVNAGSYLITPGGLTSNNYNIAFADGPLTITQLTVNLALTGSKVYDGTPTFSTAQLAINNAISGDQVSLSAGTAETADKNVGANKPFVSFSGLALTGASAGNYTLAGATGSGTITARPLSTWSGLGGNSLWSNPGNWDALPDGNNVLAVSIPVGGNVDLDGTVALSAISSAGDMSLNGHDLDIDSYTQTGGSLTGAGSLNVANGFSQTGGSISLTGAAIANIYQSSGDLNIASLSAPTANLTAATGAITQTGPIIVAALNTQSVTGTTLTDIDNQIVSFRAGNSSSGDISLINTGELNILGITNSGGDILVENTGGVTTTGVVSASGKQSITITAHSPITIGDSLIAGGDITLTAGIPGSPSVADIITINGAISGSNITLAGHSVTGTAPVPAGAVLQTYEKLVATPVIIGSLVNNTIVVPPTPDALAQAPITEDEEKKDTQVAAMDAAAPVAEPAPAVASLPVCK